jgi:phytoene synthase
VLKESSKSFALASLLFSPEVRDDAAALYAWCRRADDAIDLDPRGGQSRTLERLRLELASIYAGEPQRDPALAAFQWVVRRRAIPRQYPNALLDGLRMDTLAVRYEDLDTLLCYCFRVAGVVGLMMCHVMGVSHVAALRHAAHLGIAMQLTNICRDVQEDYWRGRLYLPAALLKSSWVALHSSRGTGSDAALRAAEEPVRRAVAALRALSDAFYRSGDRGMGYLPWRAGLAVRAARHVYAAIGRRLGRRNDDVLSGRVVVPLFEKLTLVVIALFYALIALPRALVQRFRRTDLTATVAGYPHDVLPL